MTFQRRKKKKVKAYLVKVSLIRFGERRMYLMIFARSVRSEKNKK